MTRVVREITEILGMKAGEWLVYHVGYLPVDRGENEPVNETANVAWNLYMGGKVLLAQFRVGDFQYEYRAIRLR